MKTIDPNSIPDWRKGHLTVSSLLSYWVLPLIICVGFILNEYERNVLLIAATLQILVSTFLCRMETYLCLYEIPIALSTCLALLVHCADTVPHAIGLFAASVGLCNVKLILGMSVALHRYASHAAFKCGEGLSTIVIILGCLANQGGPLWWAANHRTLRKKEGTNCFSHNQFNSINFYYNQAVTTNTVTCPKIHTAPPKWALKGPLPFTAPAPKFASSMKNLCPATLTHPSIDY